MSFANFMRFCILIMAITTTKMGLVIIHAINTFKMFPCLTCSTYHLSLSKIKGEFEFFLHEQNLIVYFASI